MTAGYIEKAKQTYESGIKLCESAQLQTPEAAEAVSSAWGRLLVDLAVLHKDVS